jgi:hypothetical protein
LKLDPDILAAADSGRYVTSGIISMNTLSKHASISNMLVDEDGEGYYRWSFDTARTEQTFSDIYLTDYLEDHVTVFEYDVRFTPAAAATAENKGLFEMASIRRTDTSGTGIFDSMLNITALGYISTPFGRLVDENGDYMVPKTWDEVAQFAAQIKEKTGKAGFVTPSINRACGWLFTPVAWSYGVEFMKKDKDGKWTATFDSQEMVDALKFYYDLKWKYDVLPADIALLDNSSAPQKLAAGEAAMLLRAPDYFDKLNSMGVDIKDFGLMPIPAGPKRHVTLLGGSGLMISEKSTDDQVDAAMIWITITTNHKLTDTIKANKIKDYEARLVENRGVGVLELSNWDEDTEVVKWEREYELENANLDLKKVETYNDFATGKGYKDLEIQPEEPMCAQELYAIIDKLVQEVFTNKNVDIAKIVKNANKDFQQNYLDYV